jgi:CxxC-x17-CxxC domain-containing protein
MMPFEDKILECRDCQQSFIFTAGEQEFFASKGLTNKPTHCSSCRIVKRLAKDGRSINSSSELACHTCGEMTRVPFKPSGIRPVYCLTCFQKQKANN